jgi:Tfp pilus assembly protein PilW
MVELVVTMALALVLFGAIVDVMVASLRSTNSNANRVGGNDALTRTMERLTRELRGATSVTVTSATTLTLHAYVTATGSPPATSHTITWDCSHTDASGLYYCSRQDVTAGTAAATELSGLTTGNVFQQVALPSGSPATYAPVGVTLSEKVSGYTNPLVLNELITPRACQYQGAGYGLGCDNS